MDEHHMSDHEWKELERASGAEVGHERGSSGLDLWLSLDGRISRSTYWLKFLLPFAGLQIVATAVDAVLASGSFETLGLFGVVTSLALVWPSIVGSVKRLHDLGHPGWFVAAYYGGSFAGVLVVAVAVAVFGQVAMVLAIPLLVLIAMGIWYSVKMMLFRGEPGPNAYGPDPLRFE